MPKARAPRPAERGRAKRLAGVVGGTLVALGGLVALGASAPAWAARADYVRARPCTGDETRDCLRTATALVLDKRIGGGKMREYDVRLDVHPDEIELPDPEPVFAALTRDGQVRVWYWRGRIVRIGVPDVGQVETGDSPRTEAVELTLYGLLALAWGAFGAWYARSDRRRRVVPDATGRLLLGAVVGSSVVFFQVLSFDVYDPVLPWVTFAAVTLAAWGAVSMRRRPSTDFRRSRSPFPVTRSSRH